MTPLQGVSPRRCIQRPRRENSRCSHCLPEGAPRPCWLTATRPHSTRTCIRLKPTGPSRLPTPWPLPCAPSPGPSVRLSSGGTCVLGGSCSACCAHPAVPFVRTDPQGLLTPPARRLLLTLSFSCREAQHAVDTRTLKAVSTFPMTP